MKLYIVLLTVLYLVSAKSIYEANENNENPSPRQRHRRRLRDPYYDYSSYYENKGYYGHHHEDMLSEISSLLQEISSYVKRPPPPPPPPQIIYIPYPYPLPQNRCPQRPSQNQNLTVRWPELDDDNMNWGLVPGDTGLNTDDGNDGKRPISLVPIESNEPMPEAPPIEHGSSQAGMNTPTTTAAPSKKSLTCQAAIIICCDVSSEEEKKNCFDSYKCSKTYATGLSCHKAVIKKAYEEFTSAYSPRN